MAKKKTTTPAAPPAPPEKTMEEIFSEYDAQARAEAARKKSEYARKIFADSETEFEMLLEKDGTQALKDAWAKVQKLQGHLTTGPTSGGGGGKERTKKADKLALLEKIKTELGKGTGMKTADIVRAIGLESKKYQTVTQWLQGMEKDREVKKTDAGWVLA